MRDYSQILSDFNSFTNNKNDQFLNLLEILKSIPSDKASNIIATILIKYALLEGTLEDGDMTQNLEILNANNNLDLTNLVPQEVLQKAKSLALEFSSSILSDLE